MFNSLRSNSTARGFAALYAGTFLSGAWAIIIPIIPVLAREFGVSAGGAAQVVTAFAVGKFCRHRDRWNRIGSDGNSFRSGGWAHGGERRGIRSCMGAVVYRDPCTCSGYGRGG